MQDSKQIDELFRLMDAVCENGDAALPALEQYLQTQTDAPEIDTEASLKKFKADHKEFFVKPHRGRRLCYRIFVVAAAVFAAGTVFALATGHNPFDYAAMWGAETFGFYRDDFPTSKDGKIIYYPDGSWDDRTNMPEYDHETYTEIPQQNATNENDSTAPVGSTENPGPIEEQIDSTYADVPDTNLTGTGLQKTTSVWDDSHRTESFDIIGSDLKSALLGLGLTQQMAPTKLPQGYSLRQINVTKNYFTNDMSILASYSNRTDSAAGSIIVSISRITEYRNNVIEKDDRAVKCYSIGNNEWYIMHNLQHLNAVAMVDGYEVGIGGAIDIAEMKKIIDSIY